MLVHSLIIPGTLRVPVNDLAMGQQRAPKKPIGKRKNRSKPVVLRGFLFESQAFMSRCGLLVICAVLPSDVKRLHFIHSFVFFLCHDVFWSLFGCFGLCCFVVRGSL